MIGRPPGTQQGGVTHTFCRETVRRFAWVLAAGQVWPYVDNALSAVARAKLEPKLKERRAAWMADITLEQCAHP